MLCDINLSWDGQAGLQVDQALAEALNRFDLSAPRALTETPAARLWRVRAADGSEQVLKLYRRGHAGNEATGAAILAAWHAAGANVAQMRAWDDSAWVMDWLEGEPLGDIARGGRVNEADLYLSRVAHDLHKATLPRMPDLPDLSDWFDALFSLRYAPECPSDLRRDMTRAAHLADHLLAGPDKRPLHGDLHHDNVLVVPRRGFVTIDAKGVLGDHAYELANAMRNPKGCGMALRDPDRQRLRRDVFARGLDINPKRFAGWAAAKCALSMAWTAQGMLAQSQEADLLAALLELSEVTPD